MTRSASRAGRPYRAVVGVLFAVGMAGVASNSTGQDDPVSREMARKKAGMLETFLEADGLRAALDAGPEAVAALVETARIHLESGSAALSVGRPHLAAALFDKGIATVTRAIALARQGATGPGRADAERVADRLRQTEAYLAVLDGEDTLSKADAARLTRLRGRIETARRLADSGATQRARALVDAIYAEAIALVTARQNGRVAFVSKTFDTAEEAFAHERARHDNFRRLVELALAERAEFQAGLAGLAANLGTLSDRLRVEAEREAAEGAMAAAVKTMRRANERLHAVLRAAGLVVTGETGQ